MKTLTRAMLLLMGLTLCSCGVVRRVSPRGPVTKIEHSISTFSALKVSNGMTVIFTMGDQERVEIEAKEEVHEYLEVYNEGATLIVKLKNGVVLSNSGGIKVYVSAKNIRGLDGSGGTEFMLTNVIETYNLHISMSGGGAFRGQLKCTNVSALLSGGSELRLSGFANNFAMTASGGSSMEGFDFEVGNYFTGTLSGGSRAELTVIKELVVRASGGSEVKYKGEGVIISKSLSGGSRISKK